MSARLAIGMGILLVILLVTYDVFNYGIELKQTPLLMTNPVMVIQANFQYSGDKETIRANCPEIFKYDYNSNYKEYYQIPLSEWNHCIETVSPSTLVKDACLEAEAEAAVLLKEVREQNELFLGLEKYDIRFQPVPTLVKFTSFADQNVCARAVKSFAREKGFSLDDTSPSSLLQVERFSTSVIAVDEAELRRLTSEPLTPESFSRDYRLTTFLIIAGVFIFLNLIYIAYTKLQERGKAEE